MRFAPLSVTIKGTEHASMPEPVSVHSNVTVTGVLFQPFAFGGGDWLARIPGGVLSRLMVTIAEAVLPATSVTVPLTTCPAPSVETSCGTAHVATPERSSEHSNVTRTSALFQPLCVRGRRLCRTNDRLRLSCSWLWSPVLTLPARSRATAVTCCRAPSVLTTCGGGQSATPLPASAQTNVTVTSVLFSTRGVGLWRE